DFSWEKMQEAKHAYERFVILFQKINRKLGEDIAKLSKVTPGNKNKFAEEFDRAMEDDFNTPIALGVLFNMVNECNKMLDENQDVSGLKELAVSINQLGGVLGLSFIPAESNEADAWIKEAIEERQKLRKEKKYKEADDVRKMLEAKGVILEDTKEGTVWRRKI
ncbi:MAG: hypothetical protein PHP17_00100, partial [Candidatus Omnitrophica bacterium]|nr:hypothetical protein [Candidatus Omnitrophota bacterium]